MTAEPRFVHAIDILLVEDSPADVRLTREVLHDSKLINRLSVAADGVEALAMLHKQGSYANFRQPDLILLDLNLPKKDGRELLSEIKTDDSLRAIPVVVLTTSASDEDVLYAYREHVNSYMRKPVRLLDFINIVRTIEQYWLGIVTLPPPEEAAG